MQINEDLVAGDLVNLISHVFEIDSYKSKIGEDGDLVVLSFTADSKAPADDLARFFEMGYDFVVDADATNGPVDNGKFKVFVEIERTRHVPKQIIELLDGASRLTGSDNWKFRYYKSFKSIPADLETLEAAIPKDIDSYNERVANNEMNNFSNFFSRGFAENVSVLEDDIRFERVFAESVNMRIKDFDRKDALYSRIPGAIKLESKDMSEIMFLTKTLGNYNITKINDTFIFENNGYAVALEMI